MRIGIFCESLSLPPKEGINVHAYNLACALAKLPDVEVLFIVCDRGWLDLSVLEEQPFDTLVVPHDEFYDYKKIVGIIEKHSLDTVQAYMNYFSAVVLSKASYATKIPMVAEFHDLEKAVVPTYLSDKQEIDFHDKLQRRTANLASLVRVMSAYDHAYIKQNWPEVSKVVSWMPVNIPDPGITLSSKTAEPNHALFIGNTSYPPNNAAATFIERTLAPAMPEATFSLVGRLTERFKGPNIRSLGMVDDITPLLTTHPVGLAPIFEGSGMKIKLLDYLSAGLVVLTTPLGAYGYPESEAIIVEEDTSKWPAILKKLFKDKEGLERRGKIARQLFLDHFDLERSVKKLVATYRRLAYAPLKVPSDFPELPVDQKKIYWLKEVRETPRQPIKKQQFFKGNV